MTELSPAARFDEHPEARYPIAIFHGHFPKVRTPRPTFHSAFSMPFLDMLLPSTALLRHHDQATVCLRIGFAGHSLT